MKLTRTIISVPSSGHPNDIERILHFTNDLLTKTSSADSTAMVWPALTASGDHYLVCLPEGTSTEVISLITQSLNGTILEW